jgi:hypothetical protein
MDHQMASGAFLAAVNFMMPIPIIDWYQQAVSMLLPLLKHLLL